MMTEKLMAMVAPSDETFDGGQCWQWLGRHRKEDRRPVNGREYAYRTLYRASHGPIPRGCGLHHRCDRPWCVNPAHLEPIRQGDHLRLHGLPGDWGQADKAQCPAGHVYTEENTYRWRNARHCRTCRLETKRRYNARHRGF